jgi:hypothetical protein
MTIIIIIIIICILGFRARHPPPFFEHATVVTHFYVWLMQEWEMRISVTYASLVTHIQLFDKIQQTLK